ncbi:MAG: phosphatidate cytidylyltransferase [Coriobacteriales bacterium]|jgi:phosphatidate cytidylyltransferase|nr:phosphatidate cytidylyltransferase [Coriobacteriales bacterium]
MTRRVITGILIVVVTLAFVLAGPLMTALFLAALAGICAWEFYAMLRSDAKLPNELIGTVSAALYPLSYYFWGFSGLLSLTTAFVLVLLIWYVFYTSARITDVAVTLFGALYTGLMLTSLILIRQIPHDQPDFFLPEVWGGVLVLLVIFSTFANDAAAFFVGSRIGRHKMAPRISPHKSWEGFLAGMVASVLLWCLVPLIPGVHIGWLWAIVGGILCGWIGILGDLVESRIKRSTGHKDSSRLLAGHGGFLDRCDSLLLVGAAASILLRFAGAIG